MADRHVALQGAQALLVEHLVDEPLVAHGHDVAALGRRDARGFLAPVLQRVEREVGETSDVATRRTDTEHPALVARSIAKIGGQHERASLAMASAVPGQIRSVG